MKLDWRFVSREFKEKFKEIQALGPGTRMHFCLAPRGEFNGRSLADVYGLIKLERQEWRVPESEFYRFVPQRTQRNTEEKMSPQMNTDDTDRKNSSEPQGQAPAAQNGATEPMSGIPIEHLAMLKPGEAMDLVDRGRQRVWQEGYDVGRKAGTDSDRYAIERELRAKMGLPDRWEQQPTMIEWHRQQLKKLVKAEEAPRCGKIFPNGTRCGSPKMKGKDYCYAHEQAEQIRPKKIELLLMEDGNSVIVNIALVQKALLDGQITPKEAGQLFYSIQTGAAVLKRVTFRETKPAEIITELPRIHRGDAETRRKPQRAQRNTEAKQVSTADECRSARINTHHGDTEETTENARSAQDCETIQNESGSDDRSREAAAEHARQTKVAGDSSSTEGSVRGDTVNNQGHPSQEDKIGVRGNAGDELNKSFISGDEGEGGTPIGSSGHRDIGTSGFGPNGAQIEGGMEQKAG